MNNKNANKQKTLFEKYNNDCVEWLEKYNLEYINSALNGKINLQDLQKDIIKNIEYKTLKHNGINTNYNLIKIRKAKNRIINGVVYEYEFIIYLLEFETMQKDEYKLLKICKI